MLGLFSYQCSTCYCNLRKDKKEKKEKKEEKEQKKRQKEKKKYEKQRREEEKTMSRAERQEKGQEERQTVSREEQNREYAEDTASFARTIYYENRTTIPDSFLFAMVKTAIDFYDSLYPMPECDIKIVLCSDHESMDSSITENFGPRASLQGCTSYFMPPKTKGDLFNMGLIVDEPAIAGAEQFFSEQSTGSRRDDNVSFELKSQRGMKLIGFANFLGKLLFEYAHLGSHYRRMEETGWTDPKKGGNPVDYCYYDERNCRYCGIYVMLKLMDPLLDRDLIYSLWVSFWDAVSQRMMEEVKIFSDHISEQRAQLETMLLFMKNLRKVKGEYLSKEMEDSLGHELYYNGELTKKGIPKLHDIEIVEYLMVDYTELDAETFENLKKDGGVNDSLSAAEMTEKTTTENLPVLYYAHNHYATPHGAELFGLMQAFHDYLVERVSSSPDSTTEGVQGSMEATTPVRERGTGLPKTALVREQGNAASSADTLDGEGELGDTAASSGEAIESSLDGTVKRKARRATKRRTAGQGTTGEEGQTEVTPLTAEEISVRMKKRMTAGDFNLAKCMKQPFYKWADEGRMKEENDMIVRMLFSI